jgi:hypothetical protein
LTAHPEGRSSIELLVDGVGVMVALIVGRLRTI